jgi:hypoxanthine phosphoribosyltransferase
MGARPVENGIADTMRLIWPLPVSCSRGTPSADHNGAGEEEDFRMGGQVNTQEHVTLSLLLSCKAIAARVNDLAVQISRDYVGKDVLLVGVLKGAFVFLADLMRGLAMPVQVDFVRLASYGKGATSAGQVRMLLDLEASIAGRHVLVVEDILDTGLTLGFLLERLRARQPASLKLCVLLSKHIRRVYDITPDYMGFDVPDGFVVGYGIDYAERYRHLPAIYNLSFATEVPDRIPQP